MTEPSNDDSGSAIDRLYAGIAQGDAAAMRACCTVDATFWHCFDGVAQDLDTAINAFLGIHTAFPTIRMQDVRRTRTVDGRIVNQHLFVGVRADGRTIGWAVCLIVTLREGLIARLEEYIDRAGTFAVKSDVMATPGLAQR